MGKEVQCSNCEKEFKQVHKNQRFCTNKCQRAFYNYNVNSDPGLKDLDKVGSRDIYGRIKKDDN